MPHKLDIIDNSIIRLLSKNARISTAQIAQILPDTSERTIRYRIKQLLDKGIIKLSTIVVPASIGLSITAEFLVRVDVGCIQSVAESLAEMDVTSYVSCILGNHDVGITIHAFDTTELYTSIAENISSIPGVKDTTIAIVPIIVKDIYHWQIPDSTVPSFVPPRTLPYFPETIVTHRINQIDRDIVHLLMEDTRMSAASISRKLDGISQRTVGDRIDSLIKQNVIRVTTVIDPNKVGFPVTANIHMRVGSKHIREVATRMAELEETSWVAFAYGDSDLSISIHVKDINALYKFVIDVVHNIPGITRTVTSLVTETLKDSFDWRIPELVLDL